MFTVALSDNGPDAAKNSLNFLLRQDPDNFEALTQLALLKFYAYDDVIATKLVVRALRVKNNYIPALVLLGELLRFNGEAKMAKKFYILAFSLDVKQTSVVKNLAFCCADLR
jgi:Tfp pilus assembly protein PilF